jgi:myosin heavy subunit
LEIEQIRWWTGEAEREAVLRTVAAVLHLGNIIFVGAADEGAAPRDNSAKAALSAVADLLQVCSI